MRVFLYHMLFLISLRKYSEISFFMCIRYVLGQNYSEYRVFAWVLRLVFPWITLQFCIRHDCCTLTRFISAPHMFRSLFGRTTKSRVWPIRHLGGEAHSSYQSLVTAIAGPCHCCLLYTSPSPRDRTRSRMPSSA